MPASVFPAWTFGTSENTEATIEQDDGTAVATIAWASGDRPAGIATVRALLYSRETGQLHKDAPIASGDVGTDTLTVRFDGLDVAYSGRYWLALKALDAEGETLAETPEGYLRVRVYGEGVYRRLSDVQEMAAQMAEDRTAVEAQVGNAADFVSAYTEWFGHAPGEDAPPPPNQPPVADATIVKNGLSVNVTDASTDADGTVASVVIEWGDDSADTVTTQGTTSPHTYDDDGTYTIIVTATDDDGATNAYTEQVTVQAAAQQVSVNVSQGDEPGSLAGSSDEPLAAQAPSLNMDVTAIVESNANVLYLFLRYIDDTHWVRLRGNQGNTKWQLEEKNGGSTNTIFSSDSGKFIPGTVKVEMRVGESPTPHTARVYHDTGSGFVEVPDATDGTGPTEIVIESGLNWGTYNHAQAVPRVVSNITLTAV